MSAGPAVPDQRFGEAVGTWIVLADHVQWDGPDQYLHHLDQMRLTKAKFPVEWHVVKSIPTTASGKIQKFRLAELPDLASTVGARLGPTSPTEGTRA